MSLQVDSLSYGYKKGITILEDIAFSIEPGEVLGLLGPNGTGKTTLLKCIQQVLTPWTGTVQIDGRDLRQLRPRQRAQLVAYVPQSLQTIFPIRVVDFIFSGRTPFVGGQMGEQDKEIVFSTISRLNLDSFAFRGLGELSGGERQRVLIARALAQTPHVLLLDEPTASLDMKNQLLTLELVQALAKDENLAVLMSIHDLNLAALCCDRILLLEGKRIQGIGPCEEILNQESIYHVYGVETEIVHSKGQTFVHLLKRTQDTFSE